MIVNAFGWIGLFHSRQFVGKAQVLLKTLAPFPASND